MIHETILKINRFSWNRGKKSLGICDKYTKFSYIFCTQNYLEAKDVGSVQLFGFAALHLDDGIIVDAQPHRACAGVMDDAAVGCEAQLL